MKKNRLTTNISYWAVALMAVGTLQGCSDFLDTVPDNRTKIDTLEKVKSLLVSAYPARSFAGFLEPRVDGVVDHGTTMTGPMSASFNYVRSGFMWEEYPAIQSSEDVEDYWTETYAAIAASNHALAAIQEMGVNQESYPYWAEAKITRAFNHFNLLTLFSDFFDEGQRDQNLGIPYVTEMEELTNKMYDRETVSATLAKIKIDLKEAMPYLGEASTYTQPKYHFTQDAARMFSLRLALFERDYPAVIEHASALIPNITQYVNLQYEQEDGTVAMLLNQDSSEVEIPHPQDPAYLFAQNTMFNWITALSQATSSTGVKLAFTNVKNPNVVLAAEPYSLLSRTSASNLYIQFTHSGNMFSQITQSNVTGVAWTLPLYNYNASLPNSPSFLPKVYEDFRTESLDATSGQPYIRYHVFRLEEALLARAEAYAMTGEYEKAMADLTMYATNKAEASNGIAELAVTRDKVVAYYSTELSQADHYLLSSYNADRFSTTAGTYEGDLQRGLVLSALDARRLEFLYEGMRWFDILRWHIPVTHTLSTGESSTLTPDDDRRVIQVPETSELSGLPKNPYDHIPSPWQ